MKRKILSVCLSFLLLTLPVLSFTSCKDTFGYKRIKRVSYTYSEYKGNVRTIKSSGFFSGYTEIYRYDFNSNSDLESFKKQFIEISEQEFNSAPADKKFSDQYVYSNSLNKLANKNGKKIYYLPKQLGKFQEELTLYDEEISEYESYKNDDLVRFVPVIYRVEKGFNAYYDYHLYFKIKINELSFIFHYIKKKGRNKFLIGHFDGDTLISEQTIECDSYTVEYF